MAFPGLVMEEGIMAGKTHGTSRIVVAALIGNAIITIVKFAISIITKSSALMAESFHSLADTGNQALLIFGIRRSSRPADEKHPFGYGKAQYFWSFVVANILFTGGAVASVYEGIMKIRRPHPIEQVHLVYLILAAAFIIEMVVFIVAVREFLAKKTHVTVLDELRGTKDSNLIVVLLEDSAALVGLLIAFFGTLLAQITGNYLIDGAASILIGIVLACVALFLANEVRKLLIGESASEEDLSLIRQTVKGFPEVLSIGMISTMHMGPDDILLAVNVDFRNDITAVELEKVIDRIEGRIREKVPAVKQIFIEADDVEGYQVSVKEGKKPPE